MDRRDLILSIYAPTFLLNFSDGVLVPTLPVYVQSLGASYAMVSLTVAAVALGTVAADLPTGVIVERFGRRPVMLAGTIASALCTLAAGLSQILPELVLFRFIAGIGAALWGISRMAYVSDVVPVAERGRVLSTFGGTMRIGLFLGPAAGGLIASLYGLTAPFFLAAFLIGLASLSAAVAPEGGVASPVKRRQLRWHVLGLVAAKQRSDLVRAGGTQILLQMVRASRQVIIPVYGASILGLDVAALGTIVSLASAVDMSLFVPAGMVMDRIGRKYTIVPSFLVLALGVALIPLSGGYVGLLAAAVTIGIGNGIGSGSMFTLGCDLAPPDATGEFLGIWRFIGDSGSFGGPVVVGGVADLVGLPVAALVLAGIGVTGALLTGVFVRETLQKCEAPISTA